MIDTDIEDEVWAIFGGREQCNDAPALDVMLRQIKITGRRLIEQEKANAAKGSVPTETPAQVAERQFKR